LSINDPLSSIALRYCRATRWKMSLVVDLAQSTIAVSEGTDILERSYHNSLDDELRPRDEFDKDPPALERFLVV
jgi:hypothetical protein